MTIPPDVMARARLLLAHAAVQRVADARGLDLLHIKGYAIDPALRWPGRVGTDVDVLVRPEHVTSLVNALRASGWVVQTGFETGSAFEHAATLQHETWGYVDVHRYFPGITVPAAAAFEVLWRDRGTATMAGVPCPVPSVAAQTLILVLHAAPLANRFRGRRDIQVAFEEAGPERQAEVRALVEELRAEVGFAAAMGGLEEFRDRPEYALWKVLSQGGTRVDEWRARVAAAPSFGAKARLVLRAPLVNVDHLTVVRGRPPTRGEIVREFFARPVRGLREEWQVKRRGAVSLPMPGCAPDRTRAGDGSAVPEWPGPGDRWSRSPAGGQGADPPPAAFELPDDVGAHAEEVGVFAARLPGGPLHVLEGVAGVIWEEAVTGDRAGLVARVAARTGADAGGIGPEVDSFLAELGAAGLLREAVPDRRGDGW